MWWFKGSCFSVSIIYREQQEPVVLEWCISDWAKRLSKCPFLQIKLVTSDSQTTGDLLCFESTLSVITVFRLISPACLLIKVKATLKTVCPFSENKEGTFILCCMNSINENWHILFSLDTGLCVYAHAYVRFTQHHTQGCQGLYRLGNECHQSTWKFLKSFQIKLCLILDSLLLNILVRVYRKLKLWTAI